MSIRSLLFVCAMAGSTLLSSTDCQAERAASAAKKTAAEAKNVELFSAMADGTIEAQIICKDSTEANILIKNLTDSPLRIQLPQAFAGVPRAKNIGPAAKLEAAQPKRVSMQLPRAFRDAPILAQFGNQGGGFGNQGGGFGGGGNQGFGGGMGGGGMGGGGMGGGGGFFNVAPQKVGKIKVAGVCLDHGKKDPNPRVKYDLKPIESYTQNKEVIEVCKMLGRGEIDQASAQAATWHLANGLSWSELAHKNKVQLSNGYTEKWFSPRQLAFAQRITAEAGKRAEKYRVLSNEEAKAESHSNN